jgi:hypothetical protein
MWRWIGQREVQKGRWQQEKARTTKEVAQAATNLKERVDYTKDPEPTGVWNTKEVVLKEKFARR